ncbi:septum site-determining protein Ssd [Mycolicibacterium thermoresistibile]
MTATTAALVLLAEPALRDDVDRAAAAAGVTVVHTHDPSSRKAWNGAAAVLLDASSAGRCADRALPRRRHVLLLGRTDPRPADWQAAIAVGAERVLTLPAQDTDLVAALADAAESARADRRRGPVVAVIGGRGGAGASLFAAALAHSAGEALLIDADPWSGGLDLLMGVESETGLRWPELAVQGGRLAFPALRDALPQCGAASVLSAGRGGADIAPEALAAVIDAGCRAGVTVVCDVPRQPTAVVETALHAADLVVLVTSADVRSCAAAAVTGRWVAAANPNVALVVRGPAPGGLRPRDVARIVDVPLAAWMRPQPRIAETLEVAGLRLRARSPLAGAARRVLTVLQQHPVVEAA